MALPGSVRRCRPTRGMLAIEFHAATSELAAIVDAEVPRRFDSDSTVMVFDPRDDDRLAILCGELRRAHIRVVEARTPLEAIFRLEEPRSRVTTIAIADSVPIEDAEKLRGFVAGAYPSIQIAQASVDQIVSAVVDA